MAMRVYLVEPSLTRSLNFGVQIFLKLLACGVPGGLNDWQFSYVPGGGFLSVLNTKDCFIYT